jgi:hypothetical protein
MGSEETATLYRQCYLQTQHVAEFASSSIGGWSTTSLLGKLFTQTSSEKCAPNGYANPAWVAHAYADGYAGNRNADYIDPDNGATGLNRFNALLGGDNFYSTLPYYTSCQQVKATAGDLPYWISCTEADSCPSPKASDTDPVDLDPAVLFVSPPPPLPPVIALPPAPPPSPLPSPPPATPPSPPPAAPTCGNTVQTSDAISLGAYTGSYEVFEYEGSFKITTTQRHMQITYGGGSEAPVGTVYDCKKRAWGGWGVGQSLCCSCSKSIDPLDATQTQMVGIQGQPNYHCYYECTVCEHATAFNRMRRSRRLEMVEDQPRPVAVNMTMRARLMKELDKDSEDGAVERARASNALLGLPWGSLTWRQRRERAKHNA